MTRYRTLTRPESYCGEPGYSYSVTFDGSVVFEGWSKGKRSDALAEVREGIRAREALRAASAVTDAVVIDPETLRLGGLL